MHGGTTPIKHGLYSKYLTDEDRDLYFQLLKGDPTEIHEEIALMRVMLRRCSAGGDRGIQLAPPVVRSLLKALERIEPIIKRVEMTGKDGGPIEFEHTEAAREKLEHILARRANQSGEEGVD